MLFTIADCERFEIIAKMEESRFSPYTSECQKILVYFKSSKNKVELVYNTWGKDIIF